MPEQERSRRRPDAAANSSTPASAWACRGGPRRAGRLGRPDPALLLDWLLANLVAIALVRDAASGSRRTAVPRPADGVRGGDLADDGVRRRKLGQRMRLRVVARLDGRPVGFARSLVRAVLVLLVIPPLVVDRDGRGLHDRLAGTVLVARALTLPELPGEAGRVGLAAGGTRPGGCLALRGSGPFGIGSWLRLADSAFSRLSTSVTSAGLRLRGSFMTGRTSLRSGTCPSPSPTTTS